LSIGAEDSKAIADAVLTLAQMDEGERKVLGKNGKRYVLEHFTYAKLANKFIDAIGG